MWSLMGFGGVKAFSAHSIGSKKCKCIGRVVVFYCVGTQQCFPWCIRSLTMRFQNSKRLTHPPYTKHVIGPNHPIHPIHSPPFLRMICAEICFLCESSTLGRYIGEVLAGAGIPVCPMRFDWWVVERAKRSWFEFSNKESSECNTIFWLKNRFVLKICHRAFGSVNLVVRYKRISYITCYLLTMCFTLSLRMNLLTCFWICH